jgi:hypothetical protein
MSTSQTKSKFPSAGQIAAWLGVIATLIGIIAGIISISQAIQPKPSASLSDQSIAATMGALQSAKDHAELQLTAYSLAELQSANQSTANAINAVQAQFQATLSAVNAQQDAFVGTQNAYAGLTATGDTVNAAATQVALNAAMTQAAIAQVSPTATPLPTATPTPAPVADYRSLAGAEIGRSGNKRMVFFVQTTQPIPDQPPAGLEYAWLLDTDTNPSTGLPVQDIGIDERVTARYDNGGWVGTLRSVASDGSEGQVFLFTDIRVTNDGLQAELDPTDFSLPSVFDWVVRAQSDRENYALLPANGHFSLTP